MVESNAKKTVACGPSARNRLGENKTKRDARVEATIAAHIAHHQSVTNRDLGESKLKREARSAGGGYRTPSSTLASVQDGARQIDNTSPEALHSISDRLGERKSKRETRTHTSDTFQDDRQEIDVDDPEAECVIEAAHNLEESEHTIEQEANHSTRGHFRQLLAEADGPHDIDVDDLEAEYVLEAAYNLEESEHVIEQEANDSTHGYFRQLLAEVDGQHPDNQEPTIFMQEPGPTEVLAEARPVEDDPARENLPRADEVDLKAQAEMRLKHQRKNRNIVICFLVVACTFALIVGLSVTSDRDDEFLPPSQTPSLVPSVTPTSFLEQVFPEASLFWEELLTDSTQEAMQQPDTPQGRALQWILNDPKQDEYPSWRLLQRFALVTFYYATFGDEWFDNMGWLKYDNHECDWSNHNTTPGFLRTYDPVTGETTGYEFGAQANICSSFDVNTTEEEELTGVVRHLWLDSNGLKGFIPEEIGLLSNLESLELRQGSASLVGGIPSTIGLLSKLVGLDLTLLDMQGLKIPSELGLCTSLRVCMLINANPGGNLPTEIGQLSDLELLLIGENVALTGSVPSELGLLAKLRWIYAVDTGLGGHLPSELGLMSSMTDLQLDANSFDGSIPEELGALSSLVYLGLSFNQLTGPLPTSLGLLKDSMFWFVVGNNALTGSLPTELGRFAGVYQFNAMNNQLTGTLPTELGNVGQYGMGGLSLGGNMLSGTVPSEIGQIPSLHFLYLQDNRLSGALPTELGLLKDGLNEFNVSNNGVTGTIPEDLCRLGDDNCTYWFFNPNLLIEEIVPCSIDFDCSTTLCGCTCVCSNLTTEG